MNNAIIANDQGPFDLSKIRLCFIASITQTLHNLSAEDAVMVRGKLIGIIGEYTVPYMFSPDFLGELSDTVFGNETFRDWLFNVRFVFFMNLAALYGQEMVSFIVDNLARSASLDLGAVEFLNAEQKEAFSAASEVPPQVAQELLGYHAAKAALGANTWMIIIMLAVAFIHLEHEVLDMPQS